jgi:hypothetical protein
MTDIFERLTQDHRKQRDLIARLKETSGDTPERRQMTEELADELRAHAKAEERTLYADMLGIRKSQDYTAHSVHEHEELENDLKAVEDADPATSAWMAHFNKLAESVVHHLDEEEEGTFEIGREVLEEERITELTAKFDEAKSLDLKRVSD